MTTVTSKTGKWQNIISRLKTAIKPSKVANGLTTEIDYYHRYVFNAKYENPVDTSINDFSKKAANRT